MSMWRLRAEIYTESVVIPSKIENDCFIILVSEFTDENSEKGSSTIPNYRLVDLSLKRKEEDILEAFAVLYNELNCFIDRLSYVSYGNVGLINIISIAPDIVELGQTFEIAVPQADLTRETKNIDLCDLHYDKPLSIENRRWERLLRIGLNANSEEEKYLSYYTLLEEIARLECTEFITRNGKETKDKKTGNFIKNILESHGLNKEDRLESEKIRQKIAHGGDEKNKEYFANIARIGSHLEEICLLELEKRIGIEIINRLKTHITDIPVFKHTCICVCVDSKDFDFVNSQLNFRTRFVKLKHTDASKFQEQSSGAGVFFKERPHLSNLAFPLMSIPNDMKIKAKKYIDLGEFYYSYREADKAIECYLTALKIAQDIGIEDATAISYANLGNCYDIKSCEKEAKRYWSLSLQIFEKLENPMSKTVQGWLDKKVITTCNNV